ncbi:hypothetical protein W97_06246 [Coniosporium apollinis CBS 100218]|uniref:Peptidase S59 domain-containing protein n=1 Tax=Coniosporium apollinis (strain CBS 100218) TaxID=1168221 RepID=R7YYH9_CONA1|nr:uncharacterized protein W97_06246 [Coniosporium apollinis CBS 100218]EON66844.1 hypothetical protein W97_06246 [Coniosporium apollinis CBS 100218]
MPRVLTPTIATGFGSTTNTSPFGAKPAFGATTTTSGGSLFGSGTATSGAPSFGGFGSTTNTAASGFGGAATTGGGLFGSQQNKPAFGTGTGGGLFGGGTTATTGFGSNTAPTAAFGAGASTTFGNQAQNNGTAATPFQPHIEKDSSTGPSSHYQTITCMPPYQGYSLEELRLADYAQGRRFGNANGQAGAFGQSTGFGAFNNTSNTSTGFGANTTANTGGGLFGSTANTSSPFGGAQQNTTSGFSSSTGGGLFGSKPAATGLFGASTTTTSGQQSGSLFGTSGTTGFGSGTGGFGTGTTGTTGGGLFGQQQNASQIQNKPAFGGFGSGTTGGFGSGTSTFGQNTTTSAGGGLFGSTTATASPFGGQQQQTATSNPFGSSFGQTNQNQQQGQTGGLFGGGFGATNTQQQQKPVGLFGGPASTTTGTSLFGQQNNTQQPQSGGLFGNANTQQSGGLFGSKPATTGTSLFGNAPASTSNTGGGLFGGLNTGQNQQTQGSNLFGQTQQQQNKPSLFGSSATTSTNTGGGLFAGLGQNNTAAQPSLFGSTQNQQPSQFGGSLFGASQQNQQAQQPQHMHASLTGNPYGNDQLLFTSLNTPASNPGPLITPLSSSQKLKKSAILPQYKLNPASSSRLITPQKRTGYGFSYSTYGTPGSATASPGGFGSSLLGAGSFGRTLGKSLSSSNLRQQWNPEDSILSPNAFSVNTGRAYGTGSLKRLQVDRSLNPRPSLFGDSSPELSNTTSSRKSVSFDTSATNGSNGANGTSNESTATPSANNALVRVETDDSNPSAEEQGLLRSSRSSANGARANGARANGAPTRPEMEQATGGELAAVPEDGSPPAAPVKDADDLARERARKARKDQELGSYWMKPSLEELRKMSPQRLKKLSGLVVGRKGAGKIEFGEVDLTGIPLEDIPGKVVQLSHRSASVYDSGSPVPKPPVGKGLNVPSVISLENSFPRSGAGTLPVHENKGPRYEKHIRRLKKVQDTEFVNYDDHTGIWTFRVEHFSRYGLDYDAEDDSLGSSMLSAPPDTPTSKGRTPAMQGSRLSQRSEEDISMLSPPESSSPDDTFDFKKGPRKNVPGGFGDEDVFDEDDEDDEDMDNEQEQSIDNTQQSFLDERSVGSALDGADERQVATPEESGMVSAEEADAADPHRPGQAMELVAADDPFIVDEPIRPKSILKDTALRETLGTPKLVIASDWATQLQQTLSPVKQNRPALRETQATLLKERDEQQMPTPKAAGNQMTFATSIDLMKSLFGQDTGRQNWPYAKRTKPNDTDSMNAEDRAFHQSFKPAWGPDSTLVYTTSGDAASMHEGLVANMKSSIVSQHRDVRFANFVPPTDLSTNTLKDQKTCTLIQRDNGGIPYAETTAGFEFGQFAQLVKVDSPAGVHEQHVWQLASILFDDVSGELPDGIPSDQLADIEWRLRKEKFSDFWRKLVQSDADKQAYKSATAEERALQHLSSYNVQEACTALIEGMNFRLATMVAQVGGDEVMRDEVGHQLDAWRDLNVLSEINEPIRAMYELLAGNCGICEGKTGGDPENQAPTFRLASRFSMDWRRAFGLRLWYGILENEPIESAVAEFEENLGDGTETVKPVPWFAEQGIDTAWQDPSPDSREDLLWGLLKIYAAQEGTFKADIATILTPENVSGNPLNARLSFQLLHLLKAQNIISPPTTTTADGNDPADALTSTYATALLAARDWPQALWTSLHLSDPAARTQAIQSILAQNAAAIEDGTPLFTTLTTELKIPPSWIWTAKALHARAVGRNAAEEVKCWQRAGEWDEAHSVLCRSVAPRAIVERDYEGLRELLEGFGGGTEGKVQGWNVGGQVYRDFVRLVAEVGEGAVHGQKKGEREAVLRRLGRGLEALGAEMGKMGLVERAAVMEMGRVVAGWVEREEVSSVLCMLSDKRLTEKLQVGEKAQVLRLPMTEDAYLRHTRELSLNYFRAVMAGGR